MSASSGGGAGCGREREARAVEPGSSLGLAEVAAPPLAEGDMMGTGRGGPLLEGSEAGYKRRGGLYPSFFRATLFFFNNSHT